MQAYAFQWSFIVLKGIALRNAVLQLLWDIIMLCEGGCLDPWTPAVTSAH